MLIRKMSDGDLPAAYRIHRLSFGTEFGLPDPMEFRGDSDVVRVRFGMYPTGCLVAEMDGEVVGFGISSRWGSVGLLGPVCVHPNFWNRGVGSELTKCNVGLFGAWGCAVSGLITNPSSPRHLRLYQAYGFWPRQLNVVMGRGTEGLTPAGIFKTVADSGRSEPDIVRDAGRLSAEMFEGMDLQAEIIGVLTQKLGSVLVAYDEDILNGFAICHHGAGSEGTSTIFYVKFAMVRGGAGSRERFTQLIRDCVATAERNNLDRVVMGVNTARHDAYRVLLDHGFRSEFQGVRMHRPLTTILDTPDCYVIDDWR